MLPGHRQVMRIKSWRYPGTDFRQRLNRIQISHLNDGAYIPPAHSTHKFALMFTLGRESRGIELEQFRSQAVQ